MDNMTQEQKNRLLAAAKIIEDGDIAVITKILEFQDFLEKYQNTYGAETAKIPPIIDDLNKVKTSFDKSISDIRGDISVNLEEVAFVISELDLKVRDLINSTETTALTRVKETYKNLLGEISRVEQNIPSLPDLSYLEERISEIESKIPVIPEILEPVVLDNPDQLASKINTLNGAINPEVIKGWDEIKKNKNGLPNDFDVRIGVSKTEIKRLTDRVVVLESGGGTGGGHVIQDEGVSLTQRTKLNFTGAGVTVTDDSGNDATVVAVSGGADATLIETPTGTIDGSNTAFTVVNTPIYVVVDGLQRFQGTGYTYSAPTITIINGAPPVEEIRSFYQVTGGTGDMVLADTQTVTGAKTFNDTTLKLAGSSSGAITLAAPAAAGSGTVTFPTSGTLLVAADVANSKIAAIGVTIDGGGSAITTGSKGYVLIPYTATVNDWTILADQSGSIVVDVKKCVYGGFPTTSSIAGSEKPTLSTAQKNQDTSLSSFTTAVTAGDIWEYFVESITTVTRVNIIFKLTKS